MALLDEINKLRERCEKELSSLDKCLGEMYWYRKRGLERLRDKLLSVNSSYDSKESKVPQAGLNSLVYEAQLFFVVDESFLALYLPETKSDVPNGLTKKEDEKLPYKYFITFYEVYCNADINPNILAFLAELILKKPSLVEFHAFLHDKVNGMNEEIMQILHQLESSKSSEAKINLIEDIKELREFTLYSLPFLKPASGMLETSTERSPLAQFIKVCVEYDKLMDKHRKVIASEIEFLSYNINIKLGVPTNENRAAIEVILAEIKFMQGMDNPNTLHNLYSFYMLKTILESISDARRYPLSTNADVAFLRNTAYQALAELLSNKDINWKDIQEGVVTVVNKVVSDQHNANYNILRPALGEAEKTETAYKLDEKSHCYHELKAAKQEFKRRYNAIKNDESLTFEQRADRVKRETEKFNTYCSYANRLQKTVQENYINKYAKVKSFFTSKTFGHGERLNDIHQIIKNIYVLYRKDEVPRTEEDKRESYRHLHNTTTEKLKSFMSEKLKKHRPAIKAAERGVMLPLSEQPRLNQVLQNFIDTEDATLKLADKHVSVSEYKV